MGKRVFTIDDKMYIVDDTGKIKTILIQEDAPVPQKAMEEIIKALAKIALKDD